MVEVHLDITIIIYKNSQLYRLDENWGRLSHLFKEVMLSGGGGGAVLMRIEYAKYCYIKCTEALNDMTTIFFISL